MCDVEVSINFIPYFHLSLSEAVCHVYCSVIQHIYRNVSRVSSEILFKKIMFYCRLTSLICDM